METQQLKPPGRGGKRPGAGRKRKEPAVAPVVAVAPVASPFIGMSPRRIAERVLLGMVDGSIPASGARLDACKEILRLSKRGGDLDPCEADSTTWAGILEGTA